MLSWVCYSHRNMVGQRPNAPETRKSFSFFYINLWLHEIFFLLCYCKAVNKETGKPKQYWLLKCKFFSVWLTWTASFSFSGMGLFYLCWGRIASSKKQKQCYCSTDFLKSQKNTTDISVREALGVSYGRNEEINHHTIWPPFHSVAGPLSTRLECDTDWIQPKTKYFKIMPHIMCNQAPLPTIL